MKAIRKLGIVVNADKPDAISLAEDLKFQASSFGVETELETDYPIQKDFLKKGDLSQTLTLMLTLSS